MGIPSFYNKLIQTIAGITSFILAKNPDVLAFDANCAVYHIHKKLQTDGVFYDCSKHDEYENKLIQETVKYFESIISEVKPNKAVYIALDGVVPFAKILQQRRRRFKSIQTKKDENAIKKSSKPFFDTNCITPGTSFMSKLNKALTTMSEKYSSPKVFVSSSDEYGEGEQKVMEFIRCNNKIYKSFLVYGLDADLIILSMLHMMKQTVEINLVREECEFNSDGSSTKLVYMNLQSLVHSLYTKYGNKDQSVEIFIKDFIGMMNILGNDFVPHAYSLKIRENGIETVLNTLQDVLKTAKYETLIKNDYSYNVDILTQLFEHLSKYEEHLILKKIHAKSVRKAGFFCSSSDPVEKELATYNDSPLEWKADSIFVTSYSTEGKLVHNWNDLYNTHILYDNKEKAIDLYLKSLSFTMDYYVGNPINTDFYYPFQYSPLFNDIYTFIKTKKITLLNVDSAETKTVIHPIVQLLCVLPEESFYLLPDKYKCVIEKYPMYWPKSFTYFSYGKYYMYECEPIIPILHTTTGLKMFENLNKTCEEIDTFESVLPIPSFKKLKHL